MNTFKAFRVHREADTLRGRLNGSDSTISAPARW